MAASRYNPTESKAEMVRETISTSSERKSIPSFPSIQEDLVVTEAISVRAPTNRIKTLSLDKRKRNEFFRDSPLTELLLKRQVLNPLLEEGSFHKKGRERKGEYFITPEAFALLLFRNIKKYREKKADEVYSIKNIFEIDNNPEKLSELLKTLHLKPGEDAKIVYISKVHAVAFYLKNEKDKIKCYIADSQGGISCAAQNIVRFVKAHFPYSEITMGPELQKDYSSCFTFSLKNMMYFIKHGAEIFPHIERVDAPIDLKTGCRKLSLENLMPPLLKFCQFNPTLSREVLDTTVSIKAKKTLEQSLKENKKMIAGKEWNTGAIKKRYKCFFELSDTLAELRVTEINATPKSPLPVSIIDAIQDHYFGPKESNFMHICMEIKNVILRESETLSPLAILYFNSLREKFPNFLEVGVEIFEQLDREFSTRGDLRKLLFIAFLANTEVNSIEDAISYALAFSNKLIKLVKKERDPAQKTIENLVAKAVDCPEDLYEAVCKMVQEEKSTPCCRCWPFSR